MLINCLVTMHFVSMSTVLSVIWYDLYDDFALAKWCSWLELIIELLLVLLVRFLSSLYVLDIVSNKSFCATTNVKTLVVIFNDNMMSKTLKILDVFYPSFKKGRFSAPIVLSNNCISPSSFFCVRLFF